MVRQAVLEVVTRKLNELPPEKRAVARNLVDDLRRLHFVIAWDGSHPDLERECDRLMSQLRELVSE